MLHGYFRVSYGSDLRPHSHLTSSHSLPVSFIALHLRELSLQKKKKKGTRLHQIPVSVSASGELNLRVFVVVFSFLVLTPHTVCVTSPICLTHCQAGRAVAVSALFAVTASGAETVPGVELQSVLSNRELKER